MYITVTSSSFQLPVISWSFSCQYVFQYRLLQWQGFTHSFSQPWLSWKEINKWPKDWQIFFWIFWNIHGLQIYMAISNLLIKAWLIFVGSVNQIMFSAILSTYFDNPGPVLPSINFFLSVRIMFILFQSF